MTKNKSLEEQEIEAWVSQTAVSEWLMIGAEKPRKSNVPEMNGQIWDECERCGHEPIYLPLELCEDCWPN